MPWLLLRVVAQNAGPAFLSTNRTVRSSTISAESKNSGTLARWTMDSVWLRSMLKVKATSRAVKGRPSAHSMPSRSFTVITVALSSYSQCSASQFSCSPVSTLNMISGSNIAGSVPRWKELAV